MAGNIMKRIIALVNTNSLYTDLYNDVEEVTSAILYEKKKRLNKNSSALLMWTDVHIGEDGAAEAIMASDNEIREFLETRQDHVFVCDVVIIDRVTHDEIERFRLTMKESL